MKSIGFFGDSFCASNQPESWCNILQEKLGANRIRWFGNPGKSIWGVFFQFNKLIEILSKGTKEEISVVLDEMETALENNMKFN